MTKKYTHFGFQEVDYDAKHSLVSSIFDNVFEKYDIMNDVMSFGLHRLWKRYLLLQADIQASHRVLDIAAGTGALGILLTKNISPKNLMLLDLNYNMLANGRKNMLNNGIVNAQYINATAEQLPFPNNCVDRILISFGLRNFTDILQSLREIYRVLDYGGKVVILEFSDITNPLCKKLYNSYANNVLSKFGNEYKYLVESIEKHVTKATLKLLLEQSGLQEVSYNSILNGLVAIHSGYKIA